MQLNHEKMLQLTARMPMKQISLPIQGADCIQIAEGSGLKPYIHRYYAGTFKDGKDLWLHNFRSSDSELHLHCHPFEFETIMLCGNYTEEYRPGMGAEIITRYTSPCQWRALDASFERLLQKLQCNIHDAAPLSAIMLGMAVEYRTVNLYDWHRITHAAQDTWTAVIVDGPRLPAWHFMDDESKSLESRKSSPRDWHKKYNCRPADGIIINDNMKENFNGNKS